MQANLFRLQFVAMTTANRDSPAARNEDAILVDDQLLIDESSVAGESDTGQPRLFAVSDGLHGTTGGHHPALELLALLKMNFQNATQDLPGRRVTRLHEEFSGLGNTRRSSRGMAATLVAMECRGAKASIYHVGDSRAWVLDKEGAQLLTTDHTYALDLLENGEIEASAFADAGNLAASLDQYFVVDSFATRPRNSLLSIALEPGQIIVLASDGISMIPGGIPNINQGEPLSAFLARIYGLALNAGSDDNISILAIKVCDP